MEKKPEQRRRKQGMHVRLDDDVQAALKTFAANREWSLAHAINHVLRRALAEKPEHG